VVEAGRSPYPRTTFVTSLKALSAVVGDVGSSEDVMEVGGGLGGAWSGEGDDSPGEPGTEYAPAV
jgi:hypothetical protein